MTPEELVALRAQAWGSYVVRLTGAQTMYLVEQAQAAASLREHHVKGSLHIMDRGEVCTGCGQAWPCRDRQILEGVQL